jgi:geranylgeranyl diphosphate synthase, type II
MGVQTDASWFATESPRLAFMAERVLERLSAAVACDTPVLRDAVSYFMRRPGKLVRPMLTLLACEAAGRDPMGCAIDFACGVELVHCSSLVFDDLPCMDNDGVRRGQPAIHVRFGEAVAILVSVHFLSRAFEMVAGADRAPAGQAVAILGNAIKPDGMIGGQLLDLSGHGDEDVVRNHKTIPLIRAAIQLGAYAAEADAVYQEALLEYATSVGLAFQLRDDILDGDAVASSQNRAESVATAAADGIRAVFGRSEAARSLIAIAEFAARRRQ